MNRDANIPYLGGNLMNKSVNALVVGTTDNSSSGLPNMSLKYDVDFDTYGKHYAVYPDILPKTGWNHIVCVKTISGYDYYFNNQKYTLPFNQDNISKSDINSALFFEKGINGYLDDIIIYNRALTQDEITTLYNSTGK